MINKILASADPVSHAGRFASLANAWTNFHLLGIEIKDLRELQADIEALKGQHARRVKGIIQYLEVHRCQRIISLNRHVE
jgi:hypothetical protein